MENRSERAVGIPLVTISREGLSVAAGLRLRDQSLSIAKTYNLPGAVSVFSSFGHEICSQLTGDNAAPSTIEIARAKIKTVLESGRSSNLQRERMIEKGYDRADYMGRMGSLFGGGLAIFKDKHLLRLIGAMAFSGGTQEEDAEICNFAIHDLDLFTDHEQTGSVLAKRLHS